MKVDLFSIGKITIHSYGLLIAVGVILCLFIAMKRAGRLGLEPEKALDIGILCVVTGFVGAKLLFVLISIPEFVREPLKVLGSSGFVVYGGIVAGVIAAIIFCRVRHLPFFRYFDLLMPSVAFAQGFGRLGCFMAGCCYGKETQLPIGVVFPEGSFAPPGVPLLPTQLFSAAGDFAIAAVLFWFSRRAKHDGEVGALYLLLYGIGRFFVEFLRTNEQGGIGVFTTAQIFSIVFAAGSLLLFYRSRRAGLKGRRRNAVTEDTF